jgi:hypothetical protein
MRIWYQNVASNPMVGSTGNMLTPLRVGGSVSNW